MNASPKGQIMQITLKNAFVGRGRELRRLESCLHQTAKGSGRFVLFCGEAGVGKTALLNDFERQGRQSGAKVASVRFSEAYTCEPYQPFLQIIKQLQKPSSAKALDSTQTIPGFHPIDPEEDRDVWNQPSLFSLQRQQALVQHRLKVAILEYAQPATILLLDDLQHAPLTAWKFIHYLSASVSEHPILLVGALRYENKMMRQSQDLPFVNVLQRMNREGTVEEITPGRFGKQEIQDLLYSIFPENDFSIPLPAMLHAATRGVPRQVRLCVEMMLKQEILVQKNGLWHHRQNITEEGLKRLVNQGGDKATLTNLWNRLAENQKDLLKYISLMRGPLIHRLFASFTGRPTHEVIKYLLSFEKLGILTKVDDESYQFAADPIRSFFLQTMSPEERHHKRERMATIIEQADYLAAGVKIPYLAHHYSKTKNWELALHYLREACTVAIRNFAFHEANLFVQRTLDILKAFPEIKYAREQVRLLTRAAWLARILGYWDESIRYCDAGVELCGQHENVDIKVHILIQKGLTHFRLNEWIRAKACFEECLQIRTELPDFDLAMIHYGLGDISFELGKYEESRQHFEVALEFANEPRAGRLRANILNNLATVENVRGNRMRSVALYTQCIPIYERLGDDFGLARIYHNIGMIHAIARNWKEANAFYIQSLNLSEQLEFRPLRSITYLSRAYALVQLKKFAEARSQNSKSYYLQKHLKNKLDVAEYHKIQGVIEREENNFAEARIQFEQAFKKFQKLKNTLGIAETEYELGLLGITMQNKDRARRWFMRSLKHFADLGLREKVTHIEETLNLI